ncbi:hypothetical protein [Paenibacillus periandrae]|uniref:hypothetical protein n=1 Tax=Paenibacillus periandrae TaxID=1761741 RepID=UPI001F092812|nr:hypothetical protein [Paenibacillus periandrae]
MEVHYSRFSSKAAEVPFAVFKDGPVSESLTQMPFIMVMDRAYGKLERLDRFKQDGQFVCHSLARQRPSGKADSVTSTKSDGITGHT